MTLHIHYLLFHFTSTGQQCCMMLAFFEQAFRLQQRDANTKESKDTVLQSDDFPLRRSPLCLTIICDNAFLPTPAKYECQAPKIGCHVTSLCQGLRRSAGGGGADPENQVAIKQNTYLLEFWETVSFVPPSSLF